MQMTVNVLVKVFKSQAKARKCATDLAKTRCKAAQSQRMRTEAEATPDQRVTEKEKGARRTWTRHNAHTRYFLTTKKGGPAWETVSNRVTINTDTGDVIQDLEIDHAADDGRPLHARLPGGVTNTTTVLYHNHSIFRQPNMT